MFPRAIYLLAKAMHYHSALNHSPKSFFSDKTTNNVTFPINAKIFFNRNTATCMLFFLLLLTFVGAFAMHIAERQYYVPKLLTQSGAIIWAPSLPFNATGSRVPDPEVWVPSPFGSYLSSVWFVIETITTVGFGDMIPVTHAGRAIACTLLVCGIVTTSLMVGTFAVTLSPNKLQSQLLRWLEQSQHQTQKEYLAARIVQRFVILFHQQVRRVSSQVACTTRLQSCTVCIYHLYVFGRACHRSKNTRFVTVP